MPSGFVISRSVPSHGVELGTIVKKEPWRVTSTFGNTPRHAHTQTERERRGQKGGGFRDWVVHFQTVAVPSCRKQMAANILHGRPLSHNSLCSASDLLGFSKTSSWRFGCRLPLPQPQPQPQGQACTETNASHSMLVCPSTPGEASAARTFRAHAASPGVSPVPRILSPALRDGAGAHRVTSDFVD